MAVFASQLTIGVVNVILPLYFRTLQLDMTKLNLIFTVFEFVLLFSMAFIGKISDLVGRRYIVTLSLLLHTIVSYFNAAATKIHEFTILRALRSVASVTDNIIAPAYVSDIFKKGIGMKLGFLHAFRHSGLAIGGMVGGVILGLLGFQQAFYLTSIITFIVFLFSATMMKEPPKEILKTDMKRGLSKELLKLAIVSIIVWMGVRAITPTIFPVYISEVFHQPPQIVGMIIGIGTLGFSLFNLIGGRLVESIGVKSTTMIGVFVYALTSLMLFFSNSLVVASVLFFVVMSFFGISNTAFSTWSVFLSRNHKKAQDIGTYRMIGGIGTMPGLIISGLIADAFGIQKVFLFASGVFFLSFILILFMLKNKTLN